MCVDISVETSEAATFEEDTISMKVDLLKYLTFPPADLLAPFNRVINLQTTFLLLMMCKSLSPFE